MSGQVTLEDRLGNIYTFPLDFWLTDHGFRVRSNVGQKAYAAGGRDMGDKYPESRTIVVSGSLRADSLADLETAMRAMAAAVLKGGKLRVTDDPVARYIEVRGPEASGPFQGDYRNERPFDIVFVCENPFWKSDTLYSATAVVTATPQDISVPASGSDFLTYPKITIDADQGVDVPSVNLRNLNDGGMQLVYNDENFVIGDQVVIDCEEGTVRRNTNDTIDKLSTARFLRLQPGTNTVRYEGNDCTIKIEWRRVYL